MRAPHPDRPVCTPALILDDLNRRIHVIRGLHVMLDMDLAELYMVETKILNRAVKRNQARFPDEFCFQLTVEEAADLKPRSEPLKEAEILRFQFGTLKSGTTWGRHRKYLPYAFTEQGVAMLSAVLRSLTAIRISVQIIETFVAMRRFLHANAGMFQRLDGIEHRQIAFKAETDRRFEQVIDALVSRDSRHPGYA